MRRIADPRRRGRTHLGLLLLVVLSAPLHGDVFEVDQLEDDNGACNLGDCSLREAILAAAANPGRDTLILTPGLHRLSIPGDGSSDASEGDLEVVSHDLDILGPPQGATIDAQGIDRVIRFFDSDSLLVNVTIRGGSRPGGLGGGIYVEASDLRLDRVWVDQNEAWRGGGLAIELGTVRMEEGAITRNSVENAGGGVFVFGVSQFAVGRFEAQNTTISGNHSDLAGGAVYLSAAAQLDLDYTTVATNTNRPGDATLANFLFRPEATVSYSLVEGTCSAGVEANCMFLSNKGEEVTVPDHGLGALQPNGGLTPSHALLDGSPALDGVPVTATCPDTDQRGVLRPLDGDDDGAPGCDVGAFERAAGAAPEVPGVGRSGLVVLAVLLLLCARRCLGAAYGSRVSLEDRLR